MAEERGVLHSGLVPSATPEARIGHRYLSMNTFEVFQNALWVIFSILNPLDQAMEVAALRRSCALGTDPGLDSSIMEHNK